MPHHHFDDTHIHWQMLAGIEHLFYSILDIDEHNKIIDVLFKFSAGQQIVLHRHKALNKTFVIQGEHRLYEADGRLKEVRKVGSDGVLYEILDDELNILGELKMQDFIDLYTAQSRL